MSTLTVILFLIPAFILFNFFYWKSLEQDYTDNKIFASAGVIFFLLIVGGIAGQLISLGLHASSIFNPSGLWFWGAVLGVILGIVVNLRLYRFKKNEFFEALVSGLWALSLVLSLATANLAMIVVILFICVVFIALKANYKKIRFYKSGKIGLASIVSLGLFFALRTIIAIFFNPGMLSFLGKIDGIISACFVFGLFLWLYNLSGR